MELQKQTNLVAWDGLPSLPVSASPSSAGPPPPAPTPAMVLFPELLVSLHPVEPAVNDLRLFIFRGPAFHPKWMAHSSLRTGSGPSISLATRKHPAHGGYANFRLNIYVNVKKIYLVDKKG